MRKDMKDVVIDIGRIRWYARSNHFRPLRRLKLVLDDDGNVDVDSPLGPKVGIKVAKFRNGGMRGLNDRLSPMLRFLKQAAQQGRKWNDVYSEACEQLDARGIRGWHAKDHLNQFVDQDRFHFKVQGRTEVDKSNAYGFWVEGGILKYRDYPRFRALNCMQQGTEKLVNVDKKWFWLDVTRDVWYEVILADYSPKYNPYTKRSIVVRDVTGWAVEAHSIRKRYGSAVKGRIPVAKRQLNSKEVKQYKLRQQPLV